jgi:exopolysaccharide biosynthesis predicted pyruvyltransferase EpsI
MIELSEMPEYRNAGVQFLYKKAEEIEAEEREELKNELRKDILGTDIDSQKLKALINKIKPAPIVGEGGGGGGTGAPEEEVKEAEKKLKEAIFGTHKS